MIATFVTLSIVFTVVVGLMVGAMVTTFFESKHRGIHILIIAILVGCAISGLFTLEKMNNDKKWNNGKCTICGQEWEIFDVEHTRNSGNIYYYKDNNGHIIELSTEK